MLLSWLARQALHLLSEQPWHILQSGHGCLRGNCLSESDCFIMAAMLVKKTFYRAMRSEFNEPVTPNLPGKEEHCMNKDVVRDTDLSRFSPCGPR